MQCKDIDPLPILRRRGFLAGILAAGFAPAAIGSGILMPVRRIAQPFDFEAFWPRANCPRFDAARRAMELAAAEHVICPPLVGPVTHRGQVFYACGRHLVAAAALSLKAEAAEAQV